MDKSLLFKLLLAVGVCQPIHAHAGIGDRYGTRDPRTCESSREPVSGALTLEHAKRYVICQYEREFNVFGGVLDLIDSIQLELGKSRVANPMTDRLIDIDYDAPVYPIRGEYVKYRCRPYTYRNTMTAAAPRNTGREGDYPGNCSRQIHSDAMGLCFKTTFGDWRCVMRSRSVTKE